MSNTVTVRIGSLTISDEFKQANNVVISDFYFYFNGNVCDWISCDTGAAATEATTGSCFKDKTSLTEIIVIPSKDSLKYFAAPVD